MKDSQPQWRDVRATLAICFLAWTSSACFSTPPAQQDVGPQPGAWTDQGWSAGSGSRVLYTRDGQPVSGAGASGAPGRGSSFTSGGAHPTTGTPPQRGVEPPGESRTYLLELYQQAVEEKDRLTLEVEALESQLAGLQATNASLSDDKQKVEAEVVALRTERDRLQSEGFELAERLATAQIRRLEAEGLLLETALETYTPSRRRRGRGAGGGRRGARTQGTLRSAAERSLRCIACSIDESGGRPLGWRSCPMMGALMVACRSTPRPPASLAISARVADFHTYGLRRIGVLPFNGEALTKADAADMSEVFCGELGFRTGYEWVRLGESDLAEVSQGDPYLRGLLSPARRDRVGAPLSVGCAAGWYGDRSAYLPSATARRDARPLGRRDRQRDLERVSRAGRRAPGGTGECLGVGRAGARDRWPRGRRARTLVAASLRALCRVPDRAALRLARPAHGHRRLRVAQVAFSKRVAGDAGYLATRATAGCPSRYPRTSVAYGARSDWVQPRSIFSAARSTPAESTSRPSSIRARRVSSRSERRASSWRAFSLFPSAAASAPSSSSPSSASVFPRTEIRTLVLGGGLRTRDGFA